MELRYGLARIYAQVSVMDTMPEGQRDGFTLSAILILYQLQGKDFFCDPADSICKSWKQEGEACADGEECAFGDCAQGTCAHGPRYSDLCVN